MACPFVAFADDRDRRADTPDRRNHCYAESVPKQRALAYQAEYCLAPAFAGCHVFLGWASRAAAAPDGTSEVPDSTSSRQPVMIDPATIGSPVDASPPSSATGSASALTDDHTASAGESSGASVLAAASPQEAGHSPALDTGRDWLFDMTLGTPRGIPESDEWVPTTAWLGLAEEDPDVGEPLEAGTSRGWDPPAREEAETTADAPLLVEPDPSGQPQATPAPIPAARLAALPVRRRRTSTRPLRPIGSGEWEEGPPISREPLVRRRLVDARIGLLLGAIILFVLGAALLLLPGPFAGKPGQEDAPGVITGASDGPAAPASGPPGSAEPDGRPAASAASTPLAESSPSGSAEPGPTPRTYRVRKGDTLSRVASRFRVTIELLQCVNGIPDPNVLSVGQELVIPRRGAKCPDQETPPPG